MFGHASFAEASFADVGGVLQLASAEMNALATSSNVGVGILVGSASVDGNFTKTTAGILITGSVNAEVSSNFTQTTEDIKVVNFTDVTMSSIFTKTTSGITILSGVSSQDLNFTKTTSGDILYVVVTTNAATESYTEVTPTGTESYTEVIPSGTESYTKIEA
jgi:hypothetical protein